MKRQWYKDAEGELWDYEAERKACLSHMGFSLSPDTTAQSSDALMEHQHCWQVLGTHHLCLKAENQLET